MVRDTTSYVSNFIVLELGESVRPNTTESLHTRDIFNVLNNSSLIDIENVFVC